MESVNQHITNFVYRSALRYTISPSTIYRKTGANLTRYGLSRRLAGHLPELSKSGIQDCIEQVMERTHELVEDDRSWEVPVPSRIHLEWASSVLAGHEVLTNLTGDPEQSHAIIDDVTQKVGRPERPQAIVRGMEHAFYHTHGIERGRKIRQLIVNSMRHYDTPWEWFVRESDARRSVVKNANCFYFHFFKKHQQLPLANIFYRLHQDVFKGIDRSQKIGFDHAASRSQFNGDSDNVFILVKLHPSPIDRNYE